MKPSTRKPRSTAAAHSGDKFLKASHYPVYTVFQLINEALSCRE